MSPNIPAKNPQVHHQVGRQHHGADHNDHDHEHYHGRVRHRCRNPRCGGKLKSPTDDPHGAFCCSGCFERYYRSRCLVCERPIAQKTKPRQICDRQKCRNEFRRHRERFEGARYPASVLTQISSRSADKTGLKTRSKRGRALAKAAGPKLSATSYYLAKLPIERDLVARLNRANAPSEPVRKVKRSTNRVRGWAVTSRWKPIGTGTDVPNIPAFLRRKPSTAATPTAVADEPPPVRATVHLELAS
jgi:hypothetical protein